MGMVEDKISVVGDWRESEPSHRASSCMVKKCLQFFLMNRANTLMTPGFWFLHGNSGAGRKTSR
jgi:hypothetical protein